MGIIDTVNRQRMDSEDAERFRAIQRANKEQEIMRDAFDQGSLAARQAYVQPAVVPTQSSGLADRLAPQGLSLDEQLNAGLISPDQYNEAVQYNSLQPMIVR